MEQKAHQSEPLQLGLSASERVPPPPKSRSQSSLSAPKTELSSFYNSWIGGTIEILTMCLSADRVPATRLPRLHFHANERDFSSPFCLVRDYFSTVRAVSVVNSSKLTHSLWLISLCLSRISLPVFEALQWADDCLGRDYYTNLSTLSAKPSAQGASLRVCVGARVCFWPFITLSLHKRKCVCMLLHDDAFVCCVCTLCVCVYSACTCVSSMTAIFASPGSCLFPAAATMSGSLPAFISDNTALHAAKSHNEPCARGACVDCFFLVCAS